MGFNKGEWSELYAFLYLLENNNLAIVDENLDVIQDDVFKILEFVFINNKYKIRNNSNILKTHISGTEIEHSIKTISDYAFLLLQKILSHKKAKGSFEIAELEPLINELLDGKKLKGSSKTKGDLEANVFDSIRLGTINLKYNIKSSLGASATLLNASNHTNFIYEVKNINDEVMNKSNAINTRTKLLDKYRYLQINGAKFNFIKVESEVFHNNLRLIDSQLDSILGKMLILSYEKNEKDIQKLLSLIIENSNDELYYKTKIGSFANAVTFGMRVSESWNGVNEVNGGIILVLKTGKVYLLDLIYFKPIVDKYLIDNIKLDSPSSGRYKMFKIYKENNKYYFKLNLQIRFK